MVKNIFMGESQGCGEEKERVEWMEKMMKKPEMKSRLENACISWLKLINSFVKMGH